MAIIAQDNIAAADRVENHIYEACKMLAENPYMGTKRENLTFRPVRFWGVYSYCIVYDPQIQPLTIVRIVHQARNLADLL